MDKWEKAMIPHTTAKDVSEPASLSEERQLRDIRVMLEKLRGEELPRYAADVLITLVSAELSRRSQGNASQGAPLSDLVHRGPPPQTTFAASPSRQAADVQAQGEVAAAWDRGYEKCLQDHNILQRQPSEVKP
jgi:hypothetical protein